MPSPTVRQHQQVGDEARQDAEDKAAINALFSRNNQRADAIDETDPAAVEAQINSMFAPQPQQKA